MEIKATDVKKLREKTGAGMMDCKNALAKTDGDFDKAERLLKEQGRIKLKRVKQILLEKKRYPHNQRDALFYGKRHLLFS